MEIKIVKEKRKTLQIVVESESVAVLKAPKNLSDKKIEDFLNSKRNWLKKIETKFKLQKQFKSVFDLQNTVYLFGLPYANKQQLFGDNVKKVETNQVKNFYLKNFGLLEEMVDNISKVTGLKYVKVMPTSSVRIWGSFNRNKVMKLNYKLLFVPKSLVQYVIVHELCHGKYMNHSPLFWKHVQSFCPNYKALKVQLNEYGFVLRQQL